MAQSVQEARAEVIALLEGSRTEMEALASRLEGALLGAGWVVRNQGVYLAFDIRDLTVEGVTSCRLTEAPRFTEANAKILAAAVRNGNNVAGEAVHIKQALREEISQLSALLLTHRAAQAL